MTRKEFYEKSENWYQRTHKLRVVWQDENETSIRRLKACNLWRIMVQRMANCFKIIQSFQQPIPPKK